jgi:preprotein translocase subunit SecB
MTTEERESEALKDRYASFLSDLNLFSISLIRSTCRVNREEYLKDDEAQVSYKLSSRSLDVQEHHFDVCSTIRLKVSTEKTKVLQLWVSATFELHFHGTPPLDQKYIKRFCDSEIKLIAWPYFREYISNLSSRMHIPPFTLPLQNNESK